MVRTAETKSSATNAVDLLMADHEAVKKLFGAYKKLMKKNADGAEKQAVTSQICQALTVHAQIEEEIFYPAVREVLDDQALIDEALVEHATCKDLIAQLKEASPDDDYYDAKVTVLGEYIDHHVAEEEGEMFKLAKKMKVDFMALGEELLARQEELKREIDGDEEPGDEKRGSRSTMKNSARGRASGGARPAASHSRSREST